VGGVVRDLTFICAFYLNQGMLLEQQRIWSSYPEDLKRRLHVIVVDDGSPHSPARDVFAPCGLASQRLYRLGVDVRWNWLACRNLAVDQATTDWVLLTDIDHVLPVETLRALLAKAAHRGRLERTLAPFPKGEVMPLVHAINREYIYRFPRVDAPRPWPYALAECPRRDEAKSYHPNSWLMTRAMFDRVGGYDERFSGFYGSDSEFRERCKITPDGAATRPASGVVVLDHPLVRYDRAVLADASTTTYERKAKTDGHNVPRIKAERDLIPSWRPLRLTFPWALEASC
jgi:hypothetical protein